MQTVARDKIGHKAAFTMIELIIVIVIVGILASVAIPKFIGSNIKNSGITLLAQIADLNTEFKKELLQQLMQGKIALDKPSYFDSDKVSKDINARGWINLSKGQNPPFKEFNRCTLHGKNTLNNNTGFKDRNCDVLGYDTPKYKVNTYYYRLSPGCLVTFLYARELATLAPYKINKDCKDKVLLSNILGISEEEPDESIDFHS